MWTREEIRKPKLWEARRTRRLSVLVSALIAFMMVGTAAPAIAQGDEPPAATVQIASNTEGSGDDMQEQGAAQCRDVIENFGYIMTNFRSATCHSAAVASALPGSFEPAIIATCTAALAGDGLPTFVATNACTMAVV